MQATTFTDTEQNDFVVGFDGVDTFITVTSNGSSIGSQMEIPVKRDDLAELALSVAGSAHFNDLFVDVRDGRAKKVVLGYEDDAIKVKIPKTEEAADRLLRKAIATLGAVVAYEHQVREEGPELMVADVVDFLGGINDAVREMAAYAQVDPAIPGRRGPIEASHGVPRVLDFGGGLTIEAYGVPGWDFPPLDLENCQAAARRSEAIQAARQRLRDACSSDF